MNSLDDTLIILRIITDKFAEWVSIDNFLPAVSLNFCMLTLFPRRAWERWYGRLVGYRYWLDAVCLIMTEVKSGKIDTEFCIFEAYSELLFTGVLVILSAQYISAILSLFLPMATLKNLAVDCCSGVFSSCPRQKMIHRNAENSHAEIITATILPVLPPFFYQTASWLVCVSTI